ncbi:MAG TPA: hypothetical protein VM716_04950 [Gemmatimonadales bacterium]|nr:hypothetical protein [Gemmatimonadales bacterium]
MRTAGVNTGRAAAAVAGLLVLTMHLPAQAPMVAPASLGEVPATAAASVLALSDQARRFLALMSTSPVEFMGCMIGEVRGDAILVERIAPADVAPSQATATWVIPTRTCEQAGWAGTVGLIHSHPTAAQCWYYFPSTQVPTSDGQSFLRNPYPVDAILCGPRVVWISRAMTQQDMPLIATAAQNVAGPAPSGP